MTPPSLLDTTRHEGARSDLAGLVPLFNPDSRAATNGLASLARPRTLGGMNRDPETFMREAIRLADQGMRAGRGGPFGCVIVRHGAIIARGSNQVTSTNDPTAHAEVTAIREACRQLGTFQLADCELYTSCEPCPMCLSAIYWARLPTVFYGNTRADAAAIGFDDDFIYQQIPLAPAQRTIRMQPLLRDDALATFRAWSDKADKVRY